MHIGSVELLARWDELARETELNKGFRREASDGARQIEYGVRENADRTGFEFCVIDANTKAEIREGYFSSDTAGIFAKELNRTRGLRPGAGRSQPGRQQEVPPAPEACRFYCLDPNNRDSLRVRVVVGTVQRSGLSWAWNVYPNLAPFEANGQFLMLPVADGGLLPHLPQLLTEEIVRDMVALCVNSSQLVIFFNSLHAGATVNHFHLQAVRHVRTLPIEKHISPDPGRSTVDGYPLNAIVFGPAVRDDIWASVRSLQARNLPFNLIYLDGRFVLFPRDDNNEIVREFPSVLASMEVCGRFIFSDAQSFGAATEGRIKTALGRIGLSYDDFGFPVR